MWTYAKISQHLKQKKTQQKLKWYDYGIKYCIYAMAVLIPVVFAPFFYSVFSTPKLMALRLLTLAILTLWGCKIFVEEKLFYRKSVLNVLLLIYATISILTTIFSVTFFTSICGAYGRFLGILTILNFLLLPFFVWNFLVEKKEIINLLKLTVLTSGLLAIYGILQFFGIFQEAFNWNQLTNERVFATIGHPNHFGAFLGMCVLIGMGLFPRCAPPWRKFLLGVFLGLMLIALYLTASRGALIATIIAIFIFAFCITLRKWKSIKQNLGKIIISIFLVLAIGISAIVVFWDQVEQTPLVQRSVSTVSSIMHGKIPDRLSWWYSSIDMIKDKPLLGHGLSTFRDIYNTYRRVDYSTLETDDMQDNITPEAAHNEYLNIAATQGLLGLFSFLAIIVFVFIKIIQTTFKTEEIKEIALLTGIRCALIVYCLQIFISFGVISTMTYFFLLLGVGMSLSNPSRQIRTLDFKGIKKYFIIVPLLVVISWCTFVTVKSGVLDYHYKQALVHSSQGDLTKAMEHFELLVNSRSHDYSFHQAYGDFALKASWSDYVDLDAKTAFMQKAVEQYEAAIKINHLHPSIYYNLGIAQFQLSALTDSDDYFQKGVVNLDLSIMKAPNNPLYPYQVGVAYMSLGREELNPKAVEYLKNALKIRTPYKNARDIIDVLSN